MSNCRQCKYTKLFKQWCTAIVLLHGCAVYTEILQIPSMLNLNLREPDVDIVNGIFNSILKSLISVLKLPPLSESVLALSI